jgi:replicative DNA helicase
LADKKQKQGNKKLTPYQTELVETIKKIKEFKLAVEANVVSILWADKDLYFTYNNLKLSDFSNNVWKVFFQIGYDVVVKEKKILDEITINFYLEKHEKLKEKYIEYGGFETIEKANQYINKENIDGYVKELYKWNTVLSMAKDGFPIADKLSEIMDMSIDDIYDEYEAKLNHLFINAETEIKSYSLSDGIDELIEKLDEGMAVGMPYYNMTLVNKDTGGQQLGNITMLAGVSNVGKSTVARSMTIPSCIDFDEPLVIMINEEGREKWQREMLVWVSNNIYKEDLQKYVVRDGKFSPEVKTLLKKCAEWIKEKDKNKTIRIIPFPKYKTSMAIKVINKYSALGVKYFILDTFKADSGNISAQTWLEMQQNMVDINDAVKPESKNVHIFITLQLHKGSTRQRYYTLDNIGVSKNVVDVASTVMMVRDLYDDEYEGEKHALKVFRLDGKRNATQIPVHLNDKKKTYQILFIVKTREGAANSYQIVLEHDKSRNIIKEVGITNVPMDF